MKIKLFLTIILLTAMVQVNAQERSIFRTGYLRLGINTLGDELDNSLSPKENVFNGRYGASQGYVFEAGHIYYFGGTRSSALLKLGLDWTMISLNYNKMDKWESYGTTAGATDFYVEGTKIAGAISSKLGPSISLNLIEKVVLDARVQVAPIVRFFDLSYSENEEMTDGRYFSFTGSGEGLGENYDPESVKNRIAFGVATSFGITVRRKAFGISADYISGDVKSNYEAIDGSSVESSGKEKIPVHNFQLKLNLTF